MKFAASCKCAVGDTNSGQLERYRRESAGCNQPAKPRWHLPGVEGEYDSPQRQTRCPVNIQNPKYPGTETPKGRKIRAGKFLRWARVAHQEWQPRPRARFRGLEKVPVPLPATIAAALASGVKAITFFFIYI